MKMMKLLVAASAFAYAQIASAGFSATVTGATDYDFRGITLSAKNPQLAGSLDYSHDNGAYVGVWASNVDFGDCCDENVEIDYYGGYTWGAEDGPNYDLGMVWYSYPGADLEGENLDYPETYISVTNGWFEGKAWYSWDYNSSGKTGFYLETNGTHALPWWELSLLGHFGYSTGNYWSKDNLEYYDWSVGLGRTFGHFDVGLKYIDGSDLDDLDETDPGGDLDHDVFSTDPKVYLSVSTTFPWEKK